MEEVPSRPDWRRRSCWNRPHVKVLEDVARGDFGKGVVEHSLHHHLHPVLDLRFQLLDQDVAVVVDKVADGVEQLRILSRLQLQVRVLDGKVEIGVCDGDSRLSVWGRDWDDSGVSLTGHDVQSALKAAVASDVEEADDAGSLVESSD